MHIFFLPTWNGGPEARDAAGIQQRKENEVWEMV